MGYKVGEGNEGIGYTDLSRNSALYRHLSPGRRPLRVRKMCILTPCPTDQYSGSRSSSGVSRLVKFLEHVTDVRAQM